MIKRIFILDDSPIKVENIKEYIQVIHPNVDITCFPCRNLALSYIYKHEKELKDSLLILDMNFPVLMDSMIEKDAGLDFLFELERKDIKMPVILCSSEEINSSYTYDYVIGKVLYDSSVYLLPIFQEILKNYI